MKLRSTWLFACILMATVLAGCNPASPPGPSEAIAPVQTSASSQTTAVITTAPLQHETSVVSSPIPAQGTTPGTIAPPPIYDLALQPLVSQAVADLAQRLSLEPTHIEVLEARAVVWPDASLGCPQPGMRYIQVPQDGALVRLQAAGQDYEYHSGGDRGLFLCEQTLKVKEPLPQIDLLPPTPNGEDTPGGEDN